MDTVKDRGQSSGARALLRPFLWAVSGVGVGGEHKAFGFFSHAL